MPDFWQKLDTLLQSSRIIVDRPKDSPHPRYPEVRYPLDYGYLGDTQSGDGDGIDVWLGSMDGDKGIVAVLATVDLVKRDIELKLLLNCSNADIEIIQKFHSSDMSACTLLRR